MVPLKVAIWKYINFRLYLFEVMHNTVLLDAFWDTELDGFSIACLDLHLLLFTAGWKEAFSGHFSILSKEPFPLGFNEREILMAGDVVVKSVIRIPVHNREANLLIIVELVRSDLLSKRCGIFIIFMRLMGGTLMYSYEICLCKFLYLFKTLPAVGKLSSRRAVAYFISLLFGKELSPGIQKISTGSVNLPFFSCVISVTIGYLIPAGLAHVMSSILRFNRKRNCNVFISKAYCKCVTWSKKISSLRKPLFEKLSHLAKFLNLICFQPAFYLIKLTRLRY